MYSILHYILIIIYFKLFGCSPPQAGQSRVCGGVRGRQVERAVSGEDSKVSYYRTHNSDIRVIVAAGKNRHCNT